MSQIRENILNAIESSLLDVKEDTTFPILVKNVTRFDENVLTAKSSDIPEILVLDTGQDEPLVEDDTHYLYRMPVTIRGFVNTATSKNVHEQLNQLISFIKQWIDSAPTLVTNVFEIRFINGEANRYDESESIADCLINMDVIYWTEKGSF